MLKFSWTLVCVIAGAFGIGVCAGYFTPKAIKAVKGTALMASILKKVKEAQPPAPSTPQPIDIKVIDVPSEDVKVTEETAKSPATFKKVDMAK